jgi:uncharacterized surface protein with fasciclin (FAS1) repeats
MEFTLMKALASRNQLGKTVGLALAAVSVFVSVPAIAKNCQQGAAKATQTTQVVGQAPDAAAGTIVEVASSSPNFKTLVTAIQAAELTETLSGTGPFTVFAPTDKAFAALPKGTLEKLLLPANKEALQKVLTYHVVPSAVESTAIKPGSVKTVEGGNVNLKVTSGKVTVNKANVIQADVKASNGVIHVIDKVLLPPGFKIK